MKKLLLNNLGLIITFPLIFNFLSNLLTSEDYFNFINFFDLTSSALIFLFLLSFGYLVKLTNNTFTLTFSIILYLISFFLFESIVYIFTTQINLHTTFILVNGLWLIYLFLNLKKKIYVLFPALTFILMRSFNLSQVNEISFSKNLTGDVVDVFLPNILKIYENNLYFSLTNTVHEGYPQFMSYLDAVIFKLSFGLDSYEFGLPTAFVFYFLFLLLFFETQLSFKNKINASLFFSILIFNSAWLQFLFTTSLMNERLASYLFLGILITIFTNSKEQNPKLVYFIFSFIFITKQFFSVLLLVCFLAFMASKKYRKNSFLLLSAFLLRELYHFTYLRGVQKDHHIVQIDIRDTILDIILFRNLSVENIVIILNNLFTDKPATYLVVLFFTTFLLSTILLRSDNTYEENLYLFLSVLNFLFILLLYISVWRDMELESPIRYIYSFIPIYIIYIYMKLDKSVNKAFAT